MISSRQLDRIPPWTWESLVSFKQQFGETRGILQFFGTMFKRTKRSEKGKGKNNYSTNILCLYYVLHSGEVFLIETRMRMVYSMDMCLRACVLRHVHFFCSPMDCNLPSSSVHGILQARILEWVTIPFFRGFSPPRNPPASLMSPALAGRFFTTEPCGKPHNTHSRYKFNVLISWGLLIP